MRAAALVLVIVLAACELPTLFETTTYRTEYCERFHVFTDPETLELDSARYEGCTDPAYEGKVVVPDGQGGWRTP